MDATELMADFRITPVVVIDNPRDAAPLAQALLDNGIGIIEITLRTDAALEAIRNAVEAVPGMLIGAGSIRRPEHFDAVIGAGARFGVCPGATPALLAAADKAEFPLVPAAITPSESLFLLEHGYRLQKFFPAEAAGGIPMLKSMAAPIPEARFMPTGGIDEQLARDYLALPNVAGVGGSWLATPELVRAGDFDEIGRRAREAAKL